MARFEPLVSSPHRRSNFITREELVAMLDRHRTISSEPLKWCICSGEGGLSYPLPTPNPRFLYRGQTKRHVPCFPSLFRHIRYPAKYMDQLDAADAASIVANMAKVYTLFSELRPHPVVKWAKRTRVSIEYHEVAQHHGLATALLDLSSSLEVAMFFATHEYDEHVGFSPCTEGRGVLYIVDRKGIPTQQLERLRSVAIQPFARPYRQQAWSCELLMGECFEECPCLAILEFDHSVELAQLVRERVESRGNLFPIDVLSVLADAVMKTDTLSRAAIAEAKKTLGRAYPEDTFGPPDELVRKAGYTMTERHAPILTKGFWEANTAVLDASLRAWLKATAEHRERIVVRHNKTGQVVAVGRLNGSLISPDDFEIVHQVERLYTGEPVDPDYATPPTLIV